jgi:hypothetical protein
MAGPGVVNVSEGSFTERGAAVFRVLPLSLVLGAFGAFLGVILFEGSQTARSLQGAQCIIPLALGSVFALVGAIAGATDAIAQAIREPETKPTGAKQHSP